MLEMRTVSEVPVLQGPAWEAALGVPLGWAGWPFPRAAECVDPSTSGVSCFKGDSGKCRDTLSSLEGKVENCSSKLDKLDGHMENVEERLEKSEARTQVCEKEIAENKSMASMNFKTVVL